MVNHGVMVHQMRRQIQADLVIAAGNHLKDERTKKWFWRWNTAKPVHALPSLIIWFSTDLHSSGQFTSWNEQQGKQTSSCDMSFIHAFLVLELSMTDASNRKPFLIILTAPRYCLLNLVAVFGVAPFQLYLWCHQTLAPKGKRIVAPGLACNHRYWMLLIAFSESNSKIQLKKKKSYAYKPCQTKTGFWRTHCFHQNNGWRISNWFAALLEIGWGDDWRTFFAQHTASGLRYGGLAALRQTISAWKGAKPCQTNPQDGHDSGISWTIMNSVLIVSVPRKQVDLRTCGCHEIRHFVVNIKFLLPKCWTGISTDLIWKTVANRRKDDFHNMPAQTQPWTDGIQCPQGRISTLKRKTLFGGSFATFAHRTLSNCG